MLLISFLRFLMPSKIRCARPWDNKESEMELDDFLKALPKDYLENRDKIVIDQDESQGGAEGSTNLSADEEFQVNEDSGDDEDTIQEQEKTEKAIDHKQELDELNVCIVYYSIS